MLAVLPVISLILLFIIFVQKAENGWRGAFFRTTIIWGLALTIITEGLSLFNALTFLGVTVSWIVFNVGLFLLYRQTSTKDRRESLESILKSIQKFFSNPYLRNCFLGILVIVSLIGLIALVAPPNTNDSMGYHMPRVMHWIQNQSVAHYPTHYTAQLYLSPWSAFAILHLQVLSGGDRFANLVQFFSMVGSIIGVSLIAQQLGANVYGQTLAAVFCATIPMGILQASSTQNDYAVAFWLVCLIYYIFLTLKKETQKTYFLEIGISLGLATLTKPTAYVYAFPFMIWLVVSQLQAVKWQIRSSRLWKHLLIIGIPAFLINLPHYLRNVGLFGTPLGKSPSFIKYTNETFSIPILLSNITRNLSLHFATPVPSVNRLLYDFINWLHVAIFKIDINDPRSSSLDFQINSLINHEDLAGNTLHLILITVSILFFFFLLRDKPLPKTLLLGHTLAIFTCFIIFCSLLAWTPFHSRLQLFMFVIASPFVGVIFSALVRPRTVLLLVAFLLFSSLPWVFFNETRPLIANSHFLTEDKVENIFNIDRRNLYFMGNRYFREPMQNATEFIKSQQCSDIGLSFHYLNIFEYPVWALLQEGDSKSYYLQHVGSPNISNVKYNLPRFANFQPCIVFNDERSDFESVSAQSENYLKAWTKEPIQIWIKK